MTRLHYLELDRHLSRQLRREFPRWLADVLWAATVVALLGGLWLAAPWVRAAASVNW